MKKQLTKNQHFVPEAYLRNFLNNENVLFTLDVQKVKKGWNEFPRRNSPGGICYIEDYYTIKEKFPENFLNLKKEDPLYIEDTVLTKLEHHIPTIFQQLSNAEKIGRDTAIDLSDLIISLKLRNPYWFENVIKPNIGPWTEKLLPELIEQGKANNKFVQRLPTWVHELISNTLKSQQTDDVDFANQFMLFSLRERFLDHTARNRRLREPLINCTWKILHAPENGPFFITTDNPGGAFGLNDHKFHTIKLDGGFIFYFPLSYNCCLFFSDNDLDYSFSNKSENKAITHLDINTEAVYDINNLLINLATKLLIGSESGYLQAILDLNKPKNNPKS